MFTSFPYFPTWVGGVGEALSIPCRIQGQNVRSASNMRVSVKEGGHLGRAQDRLFWGPKGPCGHVQGPMTYFFHEE